MKTKTKISQSNFIRKVNEDAKVEVDKRRNAGVGTDGTNFTVIKREVRESLLEEYEITK